MINDLKTATKMEPQYRIAKKYNSKFILIVGLTIFFLTSFLIKSKANSNLDQTNIEAVNQVPEEHNTQKYIPNKIFASVAKIKDYYKCFRSYNEVESKIQSFYSAVVLDYHGRKYVNSYEAKERDLDDFTENDIKSYIIEVVDKSIEYEEQEYYYLINAILHYEIRKNDGSVLHQTLPINIAITKDSHKILAISNQLQANEINELINEEVKVNIDNKLYYEKGVNDPYVIAIRNMINDHYNSTHNRNIQLEDDVDELLSQYSMDYFKSKFMLIAIEDAKYGGKWATILFLDKPDMGFFVWVYNGRIKGFGDAKLTKELLSIIQEDLKSFDKKYGF